MTKITDIEDPISYDEMVTLRNAAVNALDDLPILARLEFAKNMVFDLGGDRHSMPQDPVLIQIHDVLDGVVKVLNNHPSAAGLRSPEP